MKPDKETENKKDSLNIVAEVWDHPLGKVLLSFAGILAALGLGAVAFKIGAITMNAYKDFRDAKRR